MEKQNPFSLSLRKGRTQLLLLLFALSLLLLFLLAKFLLPYKAGESVSLSLALSLIFSILLPFVFCLYMEDGEVFAVKPAAPSVRMLDRLAAVALAAVALFLGCKALLLFLGREFTYSVLVMKPGAFTPLTVLSFALLPAFLEEWLCRGIVFSGLGHYGGLTVAILSAIFSAVLYFPSPTALPFFFVLGLLFGLLRATLQSFYPTLLLAMGLRLFLLFDALRPLPFWNVEGPNLLLLSLGGFFLFLLFSGFALVFPQMRHALKVGKEEGVSVRTLLLSPILLGALLMTLLFYFLLY